ncbi:MAG TPA: hypothetical protein EYO33_07960 [Phycisphaerales bacterium]|nr:hypothetical protein [Phycisphaerales bacterium]
MKSASRADTSVAAVRRALEEDAAKPLEFRGELSDDATVAVLDSFHPDQTSKFSLHGDMVHSVVVMSGFRESEVVKIENTTGGEVNSLMADLLYQKGPGTDEERVDGYIELCASQTLSKTNGTLKNLLAQPELNIKTINQSQGYTRVMVYKLLQDPAFFFNEPGKLTEVGERLAAISGLKNWDGSEESVHKLKQALIDRVDRVVDNSESLKSLQAEHGELLQKLRDRGVGVVTSAGNSYDDCADLTRAGFRVPEDFDDDVTSVGPKIVVGALHNMLTEDPSDDQPAYFSSRYDAVDILVDGVNVWTEAGSAWGTSYAAPKVAARREQLRREHPTWDIDFLEQQTLSEYRLYDSKAG